MPIVEFLRRFAEKKKATPAQISLAWLLAQKPFIVPIPGTRNIDHLNERVVEVTFMAHDTGVNQILYRPTRQEL